MIRALLAGQLTWNIPLLLSVIGITICYLIYLKSNKLPRHKSQLLFFLMGMSLLYLAIGSPLLALSHLSFSFHMIQMSFIFFIIPPLILLGIPKELHSTTINLSLIKNIRIILPPPKFSLITFAILFLLYHLPFLLQIILVYPLLQKGYLLVLFFLAFSMWWPVAAPDPTQRLSGFKRKRYLRESGWYIMPACLMFIIYALFEGVSNPFLGQAITHLCLPADSMIEILPAPFNTKYDQMVAGMSMMGLHKFSLIAVNKLGSKTEKY